MLSGKIKTCKYMLLILSGIVSFEIQFTQSHYKCNCACAGLCVEVCTVGACVCIYAKQKHLGCKKVQGQSEGTLHTGRRDQRFDIS